MPQFPFRQPVNPEDPVEEQQQWTPPDYAKPKKAQSPSEDWKPPDYAKLKATKPIDRVGLTDELKKAKEQETLSGNLRDAYEQTKKQLSESKLGRFISQIPSGMTALPQSMIESVRQTGRTAAGQLRGGDIHGAFQTVVSPVMGMGMIDKVNKMLEDTAYGRKTDLPSQPEAKHEVISQAAGAVGLPWDEVTKAYKEGNYGKLTGMGLSAVAIAGLAHVVGSGKVPESLKKQPPVRPTPIRPIDPTRPQSRALPEPSFIPLGPSSLEKSVPAEAPKTEPPVVQPKFNPFEGKTTTKTEAAKPSELKTTEADPLAKYGFTSENTPLVIKDDLIKLENGEMSLDEFQKAGISKLGTRGFGDFIKPGTPGDKLTSSTFYREHNAREFETQVSAPSSLTEEEPPTRIPRIQQSEMPIASRKGILPSEFSSIEDITSEQPPARNTEQRLYDLARDKFGMGKELPPEEDLARKRKESEEPQFAEDSPLLYTREMRAKSQPENVAMGGADPRVLDILGTTLYSKNRPLVATKELLQNALDEHRIIGQNEPIRIHFNESDKNPLTNKVSSSITVQDRGRGLTPDQIYTVLTDVGKSGKLEETGAAGGFGFAKASPMLGGDFSEFSSVINEKGKKVKYSFEGTPAKLKNQDIGVPLKREEVDSNTPTGFRAKVHYKEGEWLYYAKQQAQQMGKKSISNTSPVEASSSNGSTFKGHHENFLMGKLNKSNISDKIYSDTYVHKHEQEEVPPVHDTIHMPGADIDIRYTDNPRNKAQNYNMEVLNNGLYQFGHQQEYSPFGALQGVPSNIKVDVKPKVEEGLEGYPFTTNREQLESEVKSNVDKWIQDNLVSGALKKQKQSLLDIYKNMKPISGPQGTRPRVIFDPHNIFSPGELKAFSQNPFISKFSSFIDNLSNTILDNMGHQDWSDRLEKVGITLDPEVHGIHIPHPESGKSVLLINPFHHLRDTNDPYQAALENVATIFHEVGHIGESSSSESVIDWSNVDINRPGVGNFFKAFINEVKHAKNVSDVGHGISFLDRLGEIYSQTGSDVFLDSAKELHDLITGDKPSGGHSPEVQKALSDYTTKTGSTSFEKDILSRTGQQSAATGGRKGGDEGNARSDAERAVTKLFSALEDAKGRTSDQEAINRAERAKRFAAFSGVKETGVVGAAKSLSKLRGEFEKVEPGEGLGLSSKETDLLFTAVKRANITPGEKARGYTALFKLMNGDEVPVRSELAILDDVFGNNFANRITELHGGIGAIGLRVSKLANTMKTMENMVSLAAPLRHGIGMLARREFRPAFKDMFKFFMNKEFFDASMKAIEEHPKYLAAREDGLFLPKMSSGADEEFLDSYIGDIPRSTGVPQLAAASKRAYTGFLNKLKFDVYKNMTTDAEKLGYKMTKVIRDEEGEAQVVPGGKESRGIANFINTFTGRGDLGPLNKMTRELNLLLWSPRMIASRIQMFTSPKLYMDLPKEMRLEGLKSLVAIAALGTTIDTAAKYAGAKVSTNILSTDFGKSRFGTHLIDPWGGFQQYVVGMARFLAGKTDSSVPTNRLEILGRFAANKESPVASLAHTIMTAKKFTGDPRKIRPNLFGTVDPTAAGSFTNEYGQHTSVQRETMQRFLPIFEQDLQSLVQSDPEWANNIGLAAAMAGASAAGMAQNYPEKRTGKLSIGKMRLK